jgi:hypothetical protein
VNGLVFNNAQHWRLQGLELEGNASSLSREVSLSLWWADDTVANRIQGRGIAMNNAFDITIADCLIHDFPGTGLSNTGGAYLTLQDSIVYNNAWWSTAGTHGFANSKPATTDNSDTTSFKIAMQRNWVFGNQSSMISHVFSKGLVTLEIDEGNGLHMQNNDGGFVGRLLAEHNLMLFNGKAGLGLNTVDGSVIRNNGFYLNARAVENAGELSIQSSASETIANNLFHAASDRRSIKDFQNAYSGVGSNYAVTVPGDTDLPSTVIRVDEVFTDPAAGDFTPASGIPSGYGPSSSVLGTLKARAAEYGLAPAEAPTAVTRDYVQGLRAAILTAWPAPDPDDSIPEDLILADPDTGFCYAYADRNDYPGPPSTGTTCPSK